MFAVSRTIWDNAKETLCENFRYSESMEAKTEQAKEHGFWVMPVNLRPKRILYPERLAVVEGVEPVKCGGGFSQPQCPSCGL